MGVASLDGLACRLCSNHFRTNGDAFDSELAEEQTVELDGLVDDDVAFTLGHL